MTTDTPPPPPLSREELSRHMGSLDSRRLERLDRYLAHLIKWQKAINLVGPKTLDDPWRRHMLDSAQLVPLLGTPTSVVDLGSGAGFPGLVIAILTDIPVTMIESDNRKATFIREVARITETDVTVINGRAEEVAPCQADIVTARALAPLDRLLPWVRRHLKDGGAAILLKGRDVDEELTLAAKHWTMRTSRTASLSDPSATVLTLSELAPIDVG